MLLKHSTQEYCFLIIKSLPMRKLTCHLGSATKALAKPLVTLITSPLRSITTKEEGLHIRCTHCQHCSTPSRRVEDLPESHKSYKALAHLVHLDPLENHLTRLAHLAYTKL
jgi:hypothetical protein